MRLSNWCNCGRVCRTREKTGRQVQAKDRNGRPFQEKFYYLKSFKNAKIFDPNLRGFGQIGFEGCLPRAWQSTPTLARNLHEDYSL